METKESRIEFIDYLNVIACISVIALHCNGCFWRFSYERYWITSVFIETIFYFAVPIFFMITGITLIDYRKKYDTKTFFKKRIMRTVIPFLFWSVVWIIARNSYSDKSIVDLLEILINTKAQGVYWFFIPLFSCYLSIPILGLISEEKRKRAYLYMFFLSLASISIFPLFCKLLNIKYNFGLVEHICSGYIIYLLAGYLIVNCFQFTKRQRYFIYILGILGLLSRMGAVMFWSLEEGKIVNILGGIPTCRQ